jgi:predicted ribosome quality control (RQC) complex YloA/Tae2 family protein
LQECLQTESELGLAFYHERKVHWLWFDLHPLRPMVVRLNEKPPSRKKTTRPFLLFVRSRLLGRRLASVKADIARGRLLIFEFHRAADEETTGPCEIEARLFPHGQNVIVRDGKSSVSENKPKDLPSVTAPIESEPRDWETIEDQWRELTSGAGAKPTAAGGAKPGEVSPAEKEWRRAIEKKEKALERMREDLVKKTSSVHREIGEWLKANTTLDVPREWAEHIDKKKSLSWNIEECFRRAKEGARKSEGSKARIAQVEAELEKLRTYGPTTASRKEAGAQGKSDGKPAENFLTRAGARGRRHKIGEDLEAYIGKSAADNLSILRKAQPFDYWLHLRDYPGSHAILRRARNRNVTDAEFSEVGRWVVEQSLGKTAHELKGERYDLLIVECRFVRPIKGDKLGRVNYTNDRVISVRM